MQDLVALRSAVSENTGKKRTKPYARSPRIRRASWMSLGMMVTRLA